ncbi:ankyrin repeat-containing domain protein [Tribonema minus]|uniref:Ankyrin repeat-containing domain protein n=1 Tax=Tribonema minus TaxID=303371 RepID=A0A835Z4M1_9STRA|nr:ankyrin repeat-containing domain protein [Tribonema minus]
MQLLLLLLLHWQQRTHALQCAPVCDSKQEMQVELVTPLFGDQHALSIFKNLLASNIFRQIRSSSKSTKDNSMIDDTSKGQSGTSLSVAPAVRLRLRFIPLRDCVSAVQSDAPAHHAPIVIGPSLSQSQQGATNAIHRAAMAGDVRLVMALVAMLDAVAPGGKVLSLRSGEGLTALDHLIRGGRVGPVRTLLKTYGHLCMEGVESGHDSPFHNAVTAAEPAVLPHIAATAKQYERRLERHIDMFAAWGGGSSTSHVTGLPQRSPIVGHLDCTRELLAVTREVASYTSSLVPGSMHRRSYLATMACNPCATDKALGRPALMHAAANGHTRVVEALIWKGVPFKVRDASSRTPLHVAAEAGWLDVVTLLILQLDIGRPHLEEAGSRKSNLNSTSSLSADAAVSSLSASKSDALMLEGGPFRVGSLDVNGMTAEALARANGHLEVAALLQAARTLEDKESGMARHKRRGSMAAHAVLSSGESSANNSVSGTDADEYIYPCDDAL